MKKLLFIFNPAAGRGKIKAKLFDIIDVFVKHGYLVQVYPTQKRGDAAKIVTQINEPYDMLVCAGGDGTLNEVVSGQLVAGRQVPIGYLPAGSMNDVGHSFQISRNLMNAVQHTLTGSPYAMDVGKFNDKYFVYVAAFGSFTDIPYTTPQKNKNIIGNLSYYLEGIKKLSELKEKQVRIEYDNNIIEGKFIVGLVTNSLYVGGFKSVNYQKTSLNDGLLEVLLIKMPKNFYDLQTIITSLLTYKIDPAHMYYIQTGKLLVKSEQMEWTLDGEYGGAHTEVIIDNCNKAVQIMSNSLRNNDERK